MKMTRRSFLSASALALLSCPLAPTASAAKSDSLLAGLFHSEDTALPLKPLTAKGVDANPFMGSSESNIHHDCYNTDSTDAVLPVGICPEVHVAMEKTNPNASPAIFFDNFDNPISPFLGGLAIRDLDAEEVRTIGFFSPAKHDGGGYLIQSSYSFVDGRNLIVCPTSHNHVLMLRATDESGTPLPVFQKVLDINIKEAAERVLGRPEPKVGLLNIGAEPSKGTDLQRETYALLQKAKEEGRINFVGNVEAREAVEGAVDVIVSDGYSGNIFLKTMEGAGLFLGREVKKMFLKSVKTKLAALLVKNELGQFKKLMSSDEVGGTALIGISKPVIKAHGSSDAYAIKNAIRQAVEFKKAGIIEDIVENIEYMRLPVKRGQDKSEER